MSPKRQGAEWGGGKGRVSWELLHSPNFTSRGSIMSFDSCSPLFPDSTSGSDLSGGNEAQRLVKAKQLRID